MPYKKDFKAITKTKVAQSYSIQSIMKSIYSILFYQANYMQLKRTDVILIINLQRFFPMLVMLLVMLQMLLQWSSVKKIC